MWKRGQHAPAGASIGRITRRKVVKLFAPSMIEASSSDLSSWLIAAMPPRTPIWALGVRMMCLTAALDNVRSAKLIDAAGFVRMGTREAVRPDGTTRTSLYWEVTAEQWRSRWG